MPDVMQGQPGAGLPGAMNYSGPMPVGDTSGLGLLGPAALMMMRRMSMGQGSAVPQQLDPEAERQMAIMLGLVPPDPQMAQGPR
jgi:hypothetical protein